MSATRPSLPRTIFLCASFFAATLACAQTQTPPQKPAPKSAAKPGTTPPPSTEPPIASPVSRHYPILILAHGNEPSWSLRLGMKGPERLDRPGYPPIILDPESPRRPPASPGPTMPRTMPPAPTSPSS